MYRDLLRQHNLAGDCTRSAIELRRRRTSRESAIPRPARSPWRLRGSHSYNGGVLNIRDAQPEDFERLYKIDGECFVPGIAYPRNELRTNMAMANAFTLVAEVDAESMGFVIASWATARRLRARLGHIITIDVLPASQRGGIGSALLGAAETRLQREGCAAVALESAVDNAPALAFYLRHGYAITRRLPRYYLDRIDAYVLTKTFEAAC